MTRTEIEELRDRITPYLEHQDDKDRLAIVCKMAAAFADGVDRTVDHLADPESDITRWMA